MIAPWVDEEMSTVELGDVRLDARATVLLSALGEHPNLSIPAACRGRAELVAAYRFFDNDKATIPCEEWESREKHTKGDATRVVELVSPAS